MPEYPWDSTPIVVNGRTVLPYASRRCIAEGDRVPELAKSCRSCCYSSLRFRTIQKCSYGIRMLAIPGSCGA